jgi:hypothetical protein
VIITLRLADSKVVDRAGIPTFPVSPARLTRRGRAAYGPAMTEPDVPESPTPRAVRIVFAYDGDEVRVVSSRQVDMVVPEIGEPAAEPSAGLRAEVRAADGGILDRRAVRAVPADAEVFSPDPGRTVQRMPVDRPTGVFVVLVPALPDADHLALVSDEGGPAATRAVREIVRVPLRSSDGETGATS